jgi:DNA-binding transcriptional ArsR family regulator
MTTDTESVATRGRILQELSLLSDARERLESEFQMLIVEASDCGISQRAIGQHAGLSHARIGQIVRNAKIGH